MLGHRWLKLLALYAALSGIAACSGVAGSASEPCDWTVRSIRAPGPSDIPSEEHAPLLRDPDHPNNVPGPGTLRAVVKSDSLHHPHIYIENTATGTRKLLRRGSRPRWSPDGKQIACKVWESIKRPWLLCVVDVATGRSFVPDLQCLVMNYEWSPDGRSIAVGGVLPGSETNVLSLYNVRTRTSRLVDTLSVFSDYQFGWSPDSRYLAVQRPTRVVDEEEPSAADIWIFGASGTRCQLTDTPDYVESEPQWIGTDRLLVLRQPFQNNRRGGETPTVLELGRERSPPSTPSGGSP